MAHEVTSACQASILTLKLSVAFVAQRLAVISRLCAPTRCILHAGFSSGGGASGLVLGSMGGPTSLVVPPPPPGTGLAGLLLGSPLPPGLVTAGSQPQAAVAAAALLQERMGQELPAAHGLPGWVLHCACTNNGATVQGPLRT